MNPPGSGGIILQDPRTVKKRKDALISTILEEVGDDRLTTGYNITQDMTENDFYQLKKGMTSQFFVKKALEQKLQAQRRKQKVLQMSRKMLVSDQTMQKMCP